MTPSREVDNKGIVQMARKFACRALKGKGAHSGIRVIYAGFEEKNRIELIEIFYKGDKENEDRERILSRFSRASPCSGGSA